MKTSCVATVGAALFVAILSSPLHAADWPNYRGPGHDGIAPDVKIPAKMPRNALKVAWKAKTATGFSSLAIVGDRVYTMGNADDQDIVFCLDAGTGKEVWTFKYAAPLDPNLYEGGPNATPTIHEGDVYTLSRRGEVHCLNAATGEVKWSRDVRDQTGASVPSWGFSSSGYIHDNLVLFCVGPAGIALDRSTGEVVWQSGEEEAGYSTPVPFDWKGKRYVIVSSGRHYTAVDPTNGEKLWQHQWLTRYGVNASCPIVDGEYVFISTGYGKGSTLLRMTDGDPETVWVNKDFHNQLNTSVLLDGYVYGIDGDTNREATLRCIEFKTGKVMWTEEGVGSGAVIAGDGHLFVLSAKGKLGVLPATPAGFQPVAGAQILTGKCWTAPAIAGGKLYARNADGDVVCVDLP
jgi:outer membrane protein assembly factor BamB